MLTTEEALGYMTGEQMIMTRQRQIAFELEKIEEKQKKLDREWWALENWLLSDSKFAHLDDLEAAIIENKTPEVE